MSDRLLSAVLVLQCILLAALAADRLLPEAHAQSTSRCEITNWPDALTGTGFAAVAVKVVEVDKNVPVVVRDWETSDRVRVQVDDWNTSDSVKATVVDWATSDTVNVRQ
ncbi:MAG: hypothetical protein KC656_08715 [Myxococcales bacterium]|nr:hypothetical protein [Myxococcales bacterium]